MATTYTKEELTALATSENPADRKSIVNILKDKTLWGDHALSMAAVVQLTEPADRVAAILGLQAKVGGGKKGAVAGKAAPAAAAAATGKKAAVKAPAPEPEPEPEEEESPATGGVTLEEVQAAVAEGVAPILEAIAEQNTLLQQIMIVARQTALASGFTDEDLDALIAGE